MPELEFGIFDGFSESEMEGLPADVYEAHIRDARATEAMGYRYYFFHRAPERTLRLYFCSERLSCRVGSRDHDPPIWADGVSIADAPPDPPGSGRSYG